MRTALRLSLIAGILLPATVTRAAPPTRRRLPKNENVYLMENDLVYARFLALARGGAYRQINRDERGSLEVDEGTWVEDAEGIVQLHSGCRALRPRAIRSGPLYVITAGQAQIDALPDLLASLQHFLAEYADTVFDAGTVAEIYRTGAATISIERDHATFDRTDAAILATRIADAQARERTGTWSLDPVKNVGPSLFVLRGSAFGTADLPAVRRLYTADSQASPPFYFARIDAATYARQIGRWQPLHLPESSE